jgi:hypothetical protein
LAGSVDRRQRRRLAGWRAIWLTAPGEFTFAQCRMKTFQAYRLIPPDDLHWRLSKLMKIPNADFLERTGSEKRSSPRATEAAGRVLFYSSLSFNA